jgi:protein-S-isoprenylcysteine O-methyltransferase Ste14
MPVKINNPRQASWWKGSRGEWYVIVQFCILLLVVLGPRTAHWLPKWNVSVILGCRIAGWFLFLSGGVLAFAGIRQLGSNLTPLPYPRENSTLVKNGPYGLVRHPIYAGLILSSLGWGFIVHGWLTLAYAIFLFVLFDIKSRQEEKWLQEQFAEYHEYRKRVRKLIPWVY